MKKHDKAIEVLFDGITRWLITMEKKYGREAINIIKDLQFQTGYDMALQLKEQYRLGNDIGAAMNLMWISIIPFGIKMKVQEIGKGRIREEKLACPIFDVFQMNGVDFCDELCVTFNSGCLHAINANLIFEWVRKPGDGQYCIKDIVDTRSASLG